MAINPVNVTPRSKGGGGLFGKILGGLAGAVGGALVGGPAGAVTGLGLGSQLGGTAGEIAKPSKFDSSRGVPLSAMKNNPEVNFLMLDEAKKLVAADPRIPPIDAEQTISYFNQAQDQIKKRLGKV